MKTYKCRACNKVFPSRKTVRKHIRYDHEIRSEKCTYQGGKVVSKGYHNKRERNSPITELHS